MKLARNGKGRKKRKKEKEERKEIKTRYRRLRIEIKDSYTGRSKRNKLKD